MRIPPVLPANACLSGALSRSENLVFPSDAENNALEGMSHSNWSLITRGENGSPGHRVARVVAPADQDAGPGS